MKLKSITKIISFILLVSLILYFCVALLHLVNHASHEDCHVCTLLHKINDDFKGFSPDIVEIIINYIIILGCSLIYTLYILDDKKKNTLIGLKVELLN